MEPPHLKVEYIKIEKLGQGAYGEVISVKDKRNGNEFAMKIAKQDPELKYNLNVKEALAKEVAIYKTLLHPNIVSFIDSFTAIDHGTTIIEDENSEMLVMIIELCTGSAQHMMLNWDPTSKIIKGYITDVIHGLIYLKERKIIHRDITAANILVCKGTAKIADFGTAIYEGSPFASVIYNHYINSPEVLKNNEYSYASDVWALGVTVYFLIFRKYLFGAGETFRKNDALSASYDFGSIVDAQPIIKDLLIQMLNIDPRKRIKTENVLQHRFFDVKPESSETIDYFQQAWDEFGGDNRIAFYMFLANKYPDDPPMSMKKFNELFDKLYARKL